MPWHLELDALSEAEKAKEGTAIGTTKKGIGPTYMDKSERSGIRMHDFVDAERFEEVIRETGLLYTSEGLLLHAEHLLLDAVAVRAHTAEVVIGCARDVGQTLGQQTAGAAFGYCEGQLALAQAVADYLLERVNVYAVNVIAEMCIRDRVTAVEATIAAFIRLTSPSIAIKPERKCASSMPSTYSRISRP